MSTSHLNTLRATLAMLSMKHVDGPAQMIMRQGPHGSTVLAGHALGEWCPDGRDRLWTGTVILVPDTRLIADVHAFAGRRIGEMLTSQIGNSRDDSWKDEP
jgi:hypothetical protein